MTGPMDYSLCARTVTVYRKTDGGLQRIVLPGCGYLHREEMKVDKVGQKHLRDFLLIVPGDREILPGDRVLPGEGPEFTRWGELYHIPALKTVKTYTWEEAVCHREGRSF